MSLSGPSGYEETPAQGSRHRAGVRGPRIELANGGRWGLHRHLEVFGDGKAALRDAIDAGILDVLGPVASREEFAQRLTAIGIVDRSDTPL
jgi:hypothetical protein